MSGHEHAKRPWWELPGEAPGAPDYVREREQFRAELARAWNARRPERDGSQGHAGANLPRRPAAA